MAVATKSQSKTGFVRMFLQKNSQANAKAVNQAWTAAGMKGTISHTVTSEVRKQLGLVGNQPGKTKAVKAKAGAKASKTSSSPGKAMFVKEFVHDNPRANVRAINEAWRAAGFKGTISKTVVYKVKASLGLTENPTKPKTSAARKIRAIPRKVITPAVNMQPRTSNSIRTVVLNELETDIDRLIFKAMAIGNLTEFEDLLRQARRLLYGVLTRG